MRVSIGTGSVAFPGKNLVANRIVTRPQKKAGNAHNLAISLKTGGR